MSHVTTDTNWAVREFAMRPRRRAAHQTPGGTRQRPGPASHRRPSEAWAMVHAQSAYRFFDHDAHRNAGHVAKSYRVDLQAP